MQIYPEPGGPGTTAPAVVVWPAMGVPARFYLRGTGASTPRPSRRSRYAYAELVDDVAGASVAGRPAA